MNKRRWASLPADIQKTIDQMSREYIEKSGIAWDRADQSGWKFVEKRGAKKIILSQQEEQRWVEKGQKPTFDDYVKRMKAKDLPGDEALKFIMSSLKR
jgi:TRAP-type C4-dicarboxylate transport system substrate-binding protein